MKRTIVLITTEHDDCTEEKQILECAGYVIRTAASARAALELLAQLPVQVVVAFDLCLPDMSAKEFVAHLRGDWRLSETAFVMFAARRPRPPELVAAVGYAYTEAWMPARFSA
jgi:CheY-like chemotaxis protein